LRKQIPGGYQKIMSVGGIGLGEKKVYLLHKTEKPTQQGSGKAEKEGLVEKRG